MKEYLLQKLPLIEQEIDNLLKVKIDQEWYRKNVDEQMSGLDKQARNKLEFDAEAWEEAINKPMIDMLERGGKRLRPIMCVLMHEMLGGQEKNIYKLAVLPELIHNATLMVDDIEDNSLTRRGKDCTYRQFGVNIAVNNGNFFYFYPSCLANKLISSEKQKLAISELICDKMMKLHIGQAMDIVWANNKTYDKINKEKYLLMSAYKTGALLSIAMQIGAITAGADYNIRQAIDQMAIKMGVAYQIQDDILNLKAGEEWGKKIGEDITEGKITLLVVEALNKANEKDRIKLIDILKQKTTDQELIRTAIAIMENYQIFDVTSQLANDLIQECKNDLRQYWPTNHFSKIMHELLDYLVARKK